MSVSSGNLAQLGERVAVPSYDRNGLEPGIVHIGLGNFHRAHQAWYLHRLFEAGFDHDWAIWGAGVRPFDAEQRERILSQNCLTTLIELGPKGKSAEITGSMIDYVPVEEGHGPLIAALCDPRIRIVSLTVTEGGYYLDATGGFQSDHPDIEHDAQNPDAPITAFGAIVAALAKRRAAGIGPFTALSCDNLLGNGAYLSQAVVGLARMIDPALAIWIEETCSFPNSMVDCIVPATGPLEREAAEAFGVKDAIPVTHENFRQWVIEDRFCAGRPQLENVGVTFTDDVHGYETLKLRVLNAGHQIIAVPGDVLGIESISDTMADPDISALMTQVLETEVLPHLDAVPDYSPGEYLAMVQARFNNTGIVDTTRRVAFDGSSRQTGFLLPSVREALSRGGSVNGLALATACWARYCEGTREDGSAIEPNDPHWPELNAVAKAARSRPAEWLEQEDYFGDLVDAPTYAKAFDHWLRSIYDIGLRATVQAYLAGEVPG